MNIKFVSLSLFLLVFIMGFLVAVPQNSGQAIQPIGGNSGVTANDIQVQNREMVQEGEHVGENGQTFRIETEANNRVKLECNGVSAECECNMTQKKEQNKTKLNVQMSNGKNAEIKVMPDTASETALEKLRLKVCTVENNCTIQLKEVGKGNETQLAYEIQIERHSRILGIFQKKMQVRAEIATENGEVLNVDKPWWAFLASEPSEE